MQNSSQIAEDTISDELSSGRELLYGQYTIERHLIDGGFGMTYLARDSLERLVVVKECFPSTICRRVDSEVRPRKPCYQEQYQSVIRNFLREALRLSRFEHTNIVKVHQVFQENNTAYIVMDFIDGMDLLSMLDLDPGRLTDELLHKLLKDTLNALDYVHGFGMLHRDISPDNLLLDKDNKLTLIDFGAAREEEHRQTRALSNVLSVKDGYSPHEFYYTDTSQEAHSDLYSVGATFYHLITGSAPPDCQKRLAAITSGQDDPCKPLASGNWSFDKAFLSAIDKSLSVAQKKRFQSVEEWLAILADCKPVKHETPLVVQDKLDSQPSELEPCLAKVISSLVADTNSDIDPEASAERLKTKQAITTQDEDEATSQLVDMFGNPVEDVDAWMREQDKVCKRLRANQKKNGQSVENSAGSGKESTGLSRVFGSLSLIRRRSASMAQT